jgi:hypothetical protein
MRLVMIGDFFFALSLGVSILLDDSRNWKFQLGEHFSATGTAGLLILLCLFTLPFIASGIWAASRTGAGGMTPPIASDAQEERGRSETDSKDTNGFVCSEGGLYFSRP